GRIRDLIQHAELELGIDVAEERVTRFAERGGQFGPELREDAQTGLERLAAGEIVGVARLPAERLTGGLLHAREIHAARLERLQGREGIVRAHHAHYLDRMENGPRGGEE